MIRVIILVNYACAISACSESKFSSRSEVKTSTVSRMPEEADGLKKPTKSECVEQVECQLPLPEGKGLEGDF